MQHSTMSARDGSIESMSWNFPNVDHEMPYFLDCDSTSVQETPHSDILQVHPASKELAICWYENGMGFIDAINPMNQPASRRNISVGRAWGAILPLAMDVIKCSAAQASCPPEDRFQSDSGPGQRNHPHLRNGSKCDDNDGMYLPSSPAGVGCQRTNDPLPSGSTRKASTSTSMCSRPRKRQPTDKRTRGSASSRNRQAAKDQAEDIRVKLSLCRVRRERLNDLVCPVTDCEYKQLNGRMPDFRRHIRTHIPKEAEIRCKGVLWQDFIQHRRLFPRISVDERPYAVPGEDGLWIGGCLKTFSRADALRRHRRNTSCVAMPC